MARNSAFRYYNSGNSELHKQQISINEQSYAIGFNPKQRGFTHITAAPPLLMVL